MQELKPCPSCGSAAAVKEILLVWSVKYSVVCAGCGLSTALYSKKAEAVEEWRAFPDPENVMELIETITGLLREWSEAWETGVITSSENGVGAFGVDEGRVMGEGLVNDLLDRTNALLYERGAK